ncbi:MAG: DUF1036 domain-containing protein [Bacteroidales bacterium]|nr:DUF1036 domain-containing protein [Bacteroidales bacterium]MCF8376124.1 DUF1036 domain-containing protein [Bacteroidales bacterium]
MQIHKNTGVFTFALIGMIMLNSTCVIQAQEDYKRNTHVKICSLKEDNYYKVNYRFKDHWGLNRDFNIKFPVKATNRAIEQFGVPENFLEPYPNAESVLLERDRIMKQGMFYLENNILKVDKSSVVEFYSETYGKPIAENIIRLLREEKQDTRRNRIEFTMKFVQDIPYGIPNTKDRHKFNGGIFVPPQVLIKGYGDCDSKTLLFVSILVHLIDPSDIVFLGQKGHVLSGIKMEDVRGMNYYTYKENHYAIAETAGPARRSLGERGPEDQNKSVVETLEFKGDFVYDPPVYEKQETTPPTNRDDKSESNYGKMPLGPAEPIQIIAKNEYVKPVYLIVEYMNPVGDWKNRGWYRLSPGEHKLIGQTNNKYFYYYAVSEDVEWAGEKILKFANEFFHFNEVGIDRYPGEFELILSY